MVFFKVMWSKFKNYKKNNLYDVTLVDNFNIRIILLNDIKFANH